MTPEEVAINNLTSETTSLLEAVNVSKASIDARIEAAVTVSENAALDPLYSITANQITTNTLLLTLINR